MHHIYAEPIEKWLDELQLVESASHTQPEDRQACLSGAGLGYIRQRRNNSVDAYRTFLTLIFA